MIQILRSTWIYTKRNPLLDGNNLQIFFLDLFMMPELLTTLKFQPPNFPKNRLLDKESSHGFYSM